MQTASSRIRTRVAVLFFHDEKHYTRKKEYKSKEISWLLIRNKSSKERKLFSPFREEL